MHKSVVAFLCLALAGCDRGPAPISFDGAVTSDKSAQIAHGERLTHALGCTGCHGANLQGTRFYELYASNLTRELPKYSDAQFDRVIRHAERPSGQLMWGMPSHIFQHLSGPDERALLAYLRTLKPGGIPTQPMLPLEPETKAMIAKGLIKPEPHMVRETKDQWPIDAGRQYALGRYITEVTCAECHGPKLDGDPHAPMGKIPNLVVAAGYTRPEFEKLMTQGIAAGGRKINPIMTGVARTRFSHFTPHERDALYAYLKARAEEVQ